MDGVNKPLKFASTQEACEYLMIMGFTIDGNHIISDGTEMATHRVLYAIGWLEEQGFTYHANSRRKEDIKLC